MCCTSKALVTKNSTTSSSPEATQNIHHQPQAILSLDQGDPTMYESYWEEIGQECSLTMFASESLSYFSNGKNICWFLDQKLEEEIKKLHNIAANAVVDGRHIVVGTGSSQLILAALYALSAPLNLPNPVDVVSAAPYYSCYPDMVSFLRSGLYKWSGNSGRFNEDVGPYIELVTSPNNPDGCLREAVLNGEEGMVVHDLAYYWPQYTPITSPADHQLMLFTASKCAGHAGSRIGWAIVRDENVARKMVEFIVMNTIGVSKEAQLRTASIMEMVCLSCQKCDLPNFFEHSHRLMEERWKRLRETAKNSQLFHIPKFPSRFCKFSRQPTETYPAFAWMIFKEGIDGEQLLKEHNIRTRSGRRFGADKEFVRISMMSRDHEFDLFLQRLSKIHAN